MAHSADTPRIRLFVEDALTTNGLIALTAAQCHYATNVMRLAVGDHIAVLQFAYYSVISPEGCAGILWKSGERIWADRLVAALVTRS